MGLITRMDYRNGHLYVSWGTFYLVFERQDGIEYSQTVISWRIVCSIYRKIVFHMMGVEA